MLKKIRKLLKQQEGFTLVELMIVVVILGILSGIGIQQYGNIQEKARERVDDANIRIIEGAARLFLMAEEEDDLTIDNLVKNGYLEEEPESPWGDGSYSVEVTDGDLMKVKAYNSDLKSKHNKPEGGADKNLDL